MPRTVERPTHRLYTDQRRRRLWTTVPRRDDLDDDLGDDLGDRATSPRSDRKWQRAAAAEASATGNET